MNLLCDRAHSLALFPEVEAERAEVLCMHTSKMGDAQSSSEEIDCLLRVLSVACHLPLEAFLAQAHQFSVEYT